MYPFASSFYPSEPLQSPLQGGFSCLLGEIGRRIQFSGYEFWRFTGKKKANKNGYEELWNSLQRLHNTHIETDIRLGNKRRNHQFTWLSEVEQRWDGTKHIGYEVTVPDWLYDSVSKEKPWVVTLNSPD